MLEQISGATARLTRDAVSSEFTAQADAAATVQPGSLVEFETWDPRSGRLLDQAPSEPFELRCPDGPTNPVTGPLFVQQPERGDTMIVRIVSIALHLVGWCGNHADVGGFRAGSIPEPLARVCKIWEDTILFSGDLTVPVTPMIGCLGTAPNEPASTQTAGRHSGNLARPIVSVGSLVCLPILEPGGRLFVGDVHAAQGDGEVAGFGLELPAVVTLEADLRRNAR
jgi:amidase